MDQGRTLKNLFEDTVRMGGSLIILIDDGPENLMDWIYPISSSGQIPFARRKVRDLCSGLFSTRPEDLVLFFSHQAQHLHNLESKVQGQKILLSDCISQTLDKNFDYVWESCRLDEWGKVWAQVTLALSNSSADTINYGSVSPCLFLDRDNVIIKNVPYNNDPEKVELVPGVEKLIQRAHQQGYWVAMVTNQSGVGRGLVSWLEYKQVHQKTLELLAAEGCWLDDCVWATYIEGADIYAGRVLAGLRKPRGGMFQIVNSKLKVNFSDSVMVGDSATDLIAAHSVGIKKLYLLISEKLEFEKTTLDIFKEKKEDFQYTVLKNIEDLNLL
jgi:histidinol-phosphate phosphatase family protein